MTKYFSLFYLGFGLFTLFTILFSFFKDENLVKLNRSIINPSLSIFRLGGLLFLGYTLISILSDRSLQSRLDGQYYYTVIIPMIIFGVLPQIFGLSFFRNNRLIKGLLAIIFVLLSNLERFVILASSLHQDYLLSTWSVESLSKSLFIEGFIALAFYSLLVSILVFVNFVLKSIVNNDK